MSDNLPMFSDSEYDDLMLAFYRTKSFDEAKFYLSLSEGNTEYALIYGIILYELSEYNASLELLGSFRNKTSIYYQYLCYKGLEQYDEALAVLEDFEAAEECGNLRIFAFLELKSRDIPLILIKRAELKTIIGERKQALSLYSTSFVNLPTLSAFIQLTSENLILNLKQANCPNEMLLFFNNVYNLKKGCFCKKNVDNVFKAEYREYYQNRIPGIGSYFFTEIARTLFERGQFEIAKKYFEKVFSRHKYFYYNIVFYSTVLWHLKDANKLGVLCKKLIAYSRESNNTWMVLGNYFSLLGDLDRAILCIKRSLQIYPTYYGFLLLGHEQITRQDICSAERSFIRSKAILLFNYNALFGLAITAYKDNRLDSAYRYFNEGIKTNCCNKTLKLIYIQWLYKIGEHKSAMKCIMGLYARSYKDNFMLLLVSLKKKKIDDIDEKILMIMIEIFRLLNNVGRAREILNLLQRKDKHYWDVKLALDENIHTNK